MRGQKQPILQYALDLISLVCNNSYNTADRSSGRRNSFTNTRYRVDKTGRRRRIICTIGCQYQQVHRVLDKPLFGFTADTESEKERLMRLQVRCATLYTFHDSKNIIKDITLYVL